MRNFLATTVVLLLLALSGSGFAANISDNFESYAIGTFPSPTWTDLQAIFPDPHTPVPSATVVSTTDAFGHATQALTLANSPSPNRGILAPVPVSGFYTMSGDIRVDQYSDHPLNYASDFPMEMGFVNTTSPNVCCAPSAGIYASSQLGTWRVFVNTRADVIADFDLGVPATLGTWYTLQFSFSLATSTIHSVIVDTATGTVLVNQFDFVPGMDLAATGYNAIGYFGSDPIGFGDTIGDVGTVDNASGTTTPEPTTFLLIGSGLSLLAARLRKP